MAAFTLILRSLRLRHSTVTRLPTEAGGRRFDTLGIDGVDLRGFQ